MPLPDSEPSPAKANIYEQFRTKTPETLDRETLDVVRKPLDLDPASEDVLRRIKLVGEVSNTLSTSGPIETIVSEPIDVTLNSFHAVTKSDLGLDDDDDGTFLINCVYLQCTQSSPASTFYLRVYYYDATVTMPSAGALEFLYTSTPTGTFITWEGDSQKQGATPVYMQGTTQIGIKGSGSGQTSLKAWIVYTRVR